MTTTTYDGPARLVHQRGAGGHDHAWQHQATDPDAGLLFGRYRCALCRVVWEL